MSGSENGWVAVMSVAINLNTVVLSTVYYLKNRTEHNTVRSLFQDHIELKEI